MMRLPNELALQPAGVCPGDGGGGVVSMTAGGGGGGDGDASTVDDGGGDGDGESLATAGGDGDGDGGLRRLPAVVATVTERLRQRPPEAATGRRTSRKISGTSAPSPPDRRFCAFFLPVGTGYVGAAGIAATLVPPGRRRAHRRRRAAAEVASSGTFGDVPPRTLARRRLLLAPVFRIHVEAAGVKGGKGASGWRRRRRRRGSTVPDRQVDARRVHHRALARVPDHPQRGWSAASGGLGQRDAVRQEAARRVDLRLGRPLPTSVRVGRSKPPGSPRSSALAAISAHGAPWQRTSD